MQFGQITLQDYSLDDELQELSSEEISRIYWKLKLLQLAKQLSEQSKQQRTNELRQQIMQGNNGRFQTMGNRQQNQPRDINANAKVKYYKKEYKLSLPTSMFYRNQPFVNARVIFETTKQLFQRNFKDCSLCSLTLKTYLRPSQHPLQVYEEKLNRIEREISNILRRDCYSQSVENIHYNSYKVIPIQNKQYTHFVMKVPVIGDLEKAMLSQQFSLDADKRKWIKIQVAKYSRREYLSVENYSQCNSVSAWSIGYRVKNQKNEEFHTYFQPQGEYFVAFSQSMYNNEEKSKIKQICIYNCFETSIILKTIIKKEQIYQIDYSPNKEDLYIFLSSPPNYQFAVIPPNTFSKPNFITNYERCQNFLLLDHKDFKDNDFIRLYLYSNSYIHIKLDKRNEQSCRNIQRDINYLSLELNYKENILSSKINAFKNKYSVINNFDPKVIEKRFSFIYVPYKPFLTAHLRWKLSYQIMLLIRFNVMGPSDFEDFLRLVEINKDRLEDILECMRICSAGFTNKKAGLNRFKERVYQEFKRKILDYLIAQRQKGENDGQNKKRSEENSCLIYKVSLTPSGVLPNPVSNETKCRLIRQYQNCSDFFLKVTLTDDNGQAMRNKNYIYNRVLRKYLDQISFIGKKYLPLGWSGSQLKNGSLWYVSEIPKEQGLLRLMTRQSILRFLGEFDNIPIAAKKAARIGQALSSSYWYKSQNVKVSSVKDDISDKGYLFTDGIGKISKELFEDIRKQFEKRGIRFRCCLQIRYKGAKGVVLLNELLPGRTMVLRDSMIKYKCDHVAAQKYLDILNWDKYLPGFLNRQIIILLRSLDIDDSVFLEFQKKYIEKLNDLNLQQLDGSLFNIFNNQDESQDSFPLTIKNLSKSFDITKDLFFQQFLESFKDNKFKELKSKSRILIEKSARLIGVIDDYEILKEKEVYCSVQKAKQQRPYVVSGPVIITRNPSLDPADVRKCRCLSKEEVKRRFEVRGYQSNHFEHYINCIVFPKDGRIPLTAQISGSDLDGDIFFICWEERFIINQAKPIQTIDNPNEFKLKQIGHPTYSQMLDFFVDYLNNETLGKINNAHLVLADQSPNYANDEKCLKIATIHGKIVDYAKSGDAPQPIPKNLLVRQFPDFFQKWNKPTYISKSVLGKLYRQCVQQIKKRNRVHMHKNLQFDEELLRNLPLQRVKTSDVEDVVYLLMQYQKLISFLLSQFNYFSQFQLYSGSSNDSDDIKNEFGRKRLANELHRIRRVCQHVFFDENRSEYEIYRRLSSNQVKRGVRFQEKTIHKTVLAYIISYLCFCSRDNQNVLERISMKERRELCARVRTVQKNAGYKGLYLGFVWFVIPKVIINIKSGRGRS